MRERGRRSWFERAARRRAYGVGVPVIADTSRPTLLTVGHGRLDREHLGALFVGAGIEQIVDVRRFPGSRSNPAAARGEIESVAQERGIQYRHDERLGGRRHLTAREDAHSPDTWWRVPAFRAYCAWTRTPEFAAGVSDLLGDARAHRTAILCSESVWWRCHRRLIADVVTLDGTAQAVHLMHDGSLRPHPISDGARLAPDGIVWDGAGSTPVEEESP